MNKKKETGIPQQQLASMTLSTRQKKQRETERERLAVVKEIESLLSDLCKQKKGRSWSMRNQRKLGQRPNDIFED